MEKPELYIKTSSLAKLNAEYVLDQHLEFFQNIDNCVVLDVGCGPGNITHEKIFPLLPKTKKKLIGIDISRDNIEYARKHHQIDPRISYEEMDILTDDIPNEYIGTFDIIVSLFCFHFIGDHRKALKNIHKMLKPGGKVLINFMKKSLLPNMYQYVYNKPKWTKYMSNFNEVVFINQPDDSLKELFEEVGFWQVQYEEQESNYLYNSDYGFGIVQSLNMFDVPKDLEREFIEDHLEYYEVNGVLAKNDADYVLNKYLSVLQTNNNNIVLDVGCGPGNVTYEKLLPLLPTSTKQIIGVDISNNNIEYARQHYQMDPKVSYEQLDILTDTIPNKYVEAFDLIVSLYCFHLVGDHRKAFTNIYKMLKPGGKVLISFISKSLIPDMYQYVYENPKWTKYMSNFKDVVFKPQTDEFTKKLFDEIGFVQVRSEERENTYTYNKEYAYGIIKSLNLFDVPKDLEKEFIENQFEYVENSGYVDADDNGKKQYHFSHTLFVITAGKF
ncbi:hypothetical protein RN001_014417 [Aquatica leii]|uniref:Methyltransferase domain-containing protein n=1 Tax=Aquatica leii TaxID=1421715 RepID=A0AAN7QBM9_9COLE|nr:hypothetical protein RN001_014417 [Aquatica leii]